MPTILIAGKAGEGVKKASSILAEQLNQIGYKCFQYDDYQSVIKGGHNFSLITFERKAVYSCYQQADIAFFTDKESLKIHQERIQDNTLIIINCPEEMKKAVCIDFKKSFSENQIEESFYGVTAITIVLKLIGYSKEKIIEVIEHSFKRDQSRNQIVSEISLSLMYDEFNYDLKQHKPVTSRFYSGNSLIALGLIAGGLDYYTGYPMTPASTILHYLAKKKDEFGIIVQHAESELASVNMAIGAAFSGARAATGSSGGGICLMVEAFSMAGMTETPLVLINSSRPGPATGMSTYSAQSDLKFILNMGHGEFPRIVASPVNFEDAFFLSAELMDLAWKFQVPTVLLTEKHLSESMMNVDIDLNDYNPITTEFSDDDNYLRYKISEDGLSPLAFPPSKSMIKWNSNEHLENGVRTDQAQEALQMIEKRVRKGNYLKAYINENIKMIDMIGNEGFLLLTYGSTGLSVRESVKHLEFNCRIVQIRYLEPFPKEQLDEILTEPFIVIEQSITGLFAELIKEKTGRIAKSVIKRYDGRPFDPLELAKEIKERINA